MGPTYEILLWSRILGQWQLLQTASSRDSAITIASRYSEWSQVRCNGKIVYDSIAISRV